jgi:hypothetical protein
LLLTGPAASANAAAKTNNQDNNSGNINNGNRNSNVTVEQNILLLCRAA